MRQFLDTLIQDFRHSLRYLRRNPLFAGVAILTFAVGTGANTAVFSAAEALWLRPLPFTDAARIAVLGQQTTRSKMYSVAPPTYREWRDHNHSFALLSAYRYVTGNVTGINPPERVQAAAVDDGFFALMNMRLEMGRRFSHDDFQATDRVAILSYAFWQSNFGGSGDVVGRTFQFDGYPTVIVGVMGKQDVFPPATDLWIPLHLAENEWADTKAHPVWPLARLREGVTRAKATAELDVLLREAARLAPSDYEGVRPVVDSLGDVINGNMTPGLLSVLLGATAFVLLIACINVGNLQLARASARRREFAVRVALGCGRARFARQLLTESMILALLGTGAGLLIAFGAVRLMVSQMPPDTARFIAGWSRIGIDLRVLFFSILVALLSGIVSGLLPLARGLQFAPGEALKPDGGSPPLSSQKARSMLVVGEVAFAIMLLVGTVLMLQGFRRMATTTEKFAPETLLTMEVNLSSAKYNTPALKANFLEQALESLRATPGVNAAATFSAPPFSNNRVTWQTFRNPGMPPRPHMPAAVLQSVSPGFFRALNVPLFSGRDFLISDGPNAPAVTIVSEALARKFWAGQSPVGQQLLLRDKTAETPLTIIGVSGDVEYDWTDKAPEAVIYVPFSQRPQVDAMLAVRSSADIGTLAPEVRSTIARLDPDLPLSNLKTLDRLMLEALAGLFQIEGLLSSFGLLALVLATTGVYGMASYTASLRTHEVGIRMAIGANRGNVLRLMVAQTMRLLVFGIALGLLGAVGLGRVIQNLFFGTSSATPLPFVFACALLCVSGLLATLGPAWRSTRVDPMIALRS